MFDYDTISKITKANITAVNSATTTFTNSIVSLAQKNYTDLMEIAEKNPMNSVYTSWMNLLQDQYKVFAPAASKKS